MAETSGTAIMTAEPRPISARAARLLHIAYALTLVSAAFGFAISIAYDRSLPGIAQGCINGAFNGAVLSAFEIWTGSAAGARFRSLPVPALLALRFLVYLCVFLASVWGTTALFKLAGFEPWRLPLTRYLEQAFAFAFAINVVMTVRLLLGGRTLAALLLGRYRRPRAEERVVLFLDLRGSTNLAERLGDEAFHRFLNRVFYDITNPVLEAGGEIYRYVGDEIIVTWVAEPGAAAAAAQCFFAIADVLARNGRAYEAAFGAAPSLRGALHQGPLIVGEMGDVKREIVMLGDTMNTTARIEDACRATGKDVVASAALLRAAQPLPRGIAATSLGAHALRGKGEELELFALARA